MNAKCEWKAGNTTSFHWTRNELMPPPSPYPNLQRIYADGLGESRCSPLYPVAGSDDERVFLRTEIQVQGADPTAFTVDVKGWNAIDYTCNGIDWSGFEGAVWIEAADGTVLGEKICCRPTG
ncbi:hypothetical protein M3Y99_00509400 [Aphelenchoides fujianensis]|nr:hypothetical protein M3Y99_00509400 [Aphelenchoides fujianensis]